MSFALIGRWCSMRSKKTWQSFGIFLQFMPGLIKMLVTVKVGVGYALGNDYINFVLPRF